MKLEDVPNIILSASGKGGVGKTTVSSDIARAASEVLDGSVGLIDADISTPNSAQVLGGEEFDIDDQRLSTSDSIVPPEVGGVQLVSKGLVLPDDVPVLRGAQWRAEVVVDYIRNAEWADDTEVVVVDSPPGSGEELQVIASAVPITHAYVVVTPHPSAVRDAKKTHEFFKQTEVPHTAVTNMAYIPAADVLSHLDVDFTDVEGVGDGTAASLVGHIKENAGDLELFGYDPSEPVDIGVEVDVTVPYTERDDRRREVWEPVIAGEVEG